MIVIVGDKQFYSKEEVRDYCRFLLHKTAELTNDDTIFLINLLSMHPAAADKIGVGIEHFEVRINRYNQKCFWLIRVDGSETDFSFLKCVHAPTKRQLAYRGMRNAVDDQIIAYRNRIFGRGPVYCAVTGEHIAHTFYCHIDHAPPWTFKNIAEAFIEIEGSVPECVGGEDGVVGALLRDTAVSDRWKEFHLARAELRAVTIEANLSLLRRQMRDKRQDIKAA
jgi:hypothetical protein